MFGRIYDTVILYICFAGLFVVAAFILRYIVTVSVSLSVISSDEIAQIRTEQDDIYSKEQEYIQILKSDTKGEYEVNVYETPYGKGYQVIEYVNGKTIATGYGPSAQDYTYSIDNPFYIPSSTNPSRDFDTRTFDTP